MSGEVQGRNGPPSSRHWNVDAGSLEEKLNVGVVSAVAPAGAARIVESGAVTSRTSRPLWLQAVQHRCYTWKLVPTRHPRKMITITPDRAALLDQVAGFEGRRPDLGGLVDEGARARVMRLKDASRSAEAARRRLADRVRRRSLGQDADAADRVKRLGA